MPPPRQPKADRMMDVRKALKQLCPGKREMARCAVPPDCDTMASMLGWEDHRMLASDKSRHRRTALVACLLCSMLVACGGGGGGNPSAPPSGGGAPPPNPSSEVAATFAYDAASQYASVLRPCTYAGSATQQCTLATLPFLGQNTTSAPVVQSHISPTVDEVMARALVSHRWMGDNFRAILER